MPNYEATQGRDGRESRELVLTHNEFVYVQDDTKGQVTTLVGPSTKQLAQSEKLVMFNEQTGRFERVDNITRAVSIFPFAPEGSYIVLTNPAHDGGKAHPEAGVCYLPDVDWGRKINLPGPVTFALWPGQTAQVLEGHHLRSNQYLIVRVYNEEHALSNWSKSVVRRVEGGTDKKRSTVEESAATKQSAPTDLTMGKLYIIKGTEVSFYIPPTGVEVVPDQDNQYVRDAVTLETLEYSILKDENGKKRYERGPQVVFPAATETFIEDGNERKFRAIELNPDMGIHIKVIQSYEEGEGDNKKTVKVGEELFVTGKQTSIYFPRPEHAIIKYGDRDRHYGVVIPEGDARYVLNKTTEAIELVRGPQIFLADPRSQIIVKRVLDLQTVNLWYPSNREAQAYNERLRSMNEGSRQFVTDETVRGAQRGTESKGSATSDTMQRGTAFTPPRFITLDNKYDGAVQVSPWSGYAIQVVSKTGERKVIMGPATATLKFDETLEILELSTGTPKGDERPIRTVYLNVSNNKVSDRVNAETKDLVPVQVTLSYRVNFEGNSSKWFSVSNYIKLLTEHLRSVIRGVVKQFGIERFYDEATPILRDAILGEHPDQGKRPGKMFEENGMNIYDVEVLDVKIDDEEISTLIERARRAAVQSNLSVVERERQLETTRRLEIINQGIKAAQTETILKNAEQDAKAEQTKAAFVSETAMKRLALEVVLMVEDLKLGLTKIDAEAQQVAERNKSALVNQRATDELIQIRLKTEKVQADQRQEIEERDQQLKIQLLETEAKAFVERMKALGPEFAAALEKFGDHQFAAELAKALSPLAIAEQQGVSHIMDRLFGQDSAVSKMLTTALTTGDKRK
ncbi:MAG: hypothetical protein UU48_C0006G0089 [Candidatus Uhrbacteria bacterium GW2011_GWF2_41_16]|uniref:Major vault protein shoulder domain-containing protein n=2 Tax=Candidatus Uhriibacteriota TaxID=1752732 RepID=A0A0G0VAW0_9BACT|nr:MAG: hypothetical protein UU35_C0007G0043 [Candidatus Uhrbacteria bacterium GW2011_GWC2_41_11]KKR98049.1 MAG: hypothetical protein UU48_C0006G0089 [Candidatus Uhrbacteria bacterium GW2011_GWF2_41_16]